MPNNMVRPSSRSSSDKDPKPKTRPSLGGLPVVSENLGEAMAGINEDKIEIIMAERGI